MWSELAAKDLTDSDVLKTEALRMKWMANPITKIENFEPFLKYVISMAKELLL